MLVHQIIVNRIKTIVNLVTLSFSQGVAKNTDVVGNLTIRRFETVKGLVFGFFVHLITFLNSDANASAILRYELNPGIFKSCLDRGNGAFAQLFAPFKAGDRVGGNARSLRKIADAEASCRPSHFALHRVHS